MMRVIPSLLATAGLALAIQVPEGTTLQIRLTTALNTTSAKANDTFRAVVIAPVAAGDRIAIGAGAVIAGHIQAVKAAPQPDDQAELQLSFDEISDPGGKSVKIAARLSGIDNARETIDEQGKILGIVASQTGSGRLDQGIRKVSQKYPGLADLLGAVKQTVLKETDGNIIYQPGVEMTIELTKALNWTAPAHPADVRDIEPAAALARLVASQPFRTTADRPAKPSDMTNLMFLGSQEQIEAAFRKAGWSTAEELNAKSKLETFRAMAEQRGYQEAPVSILRLDGNAPDMVFQKQNNTFASRHHLRIWKRPGLFRGREVWVCAATHDIGIDFSEENRTFIHKVDTEIDHERAKVTTDLLFTGLVRGLAFVEREEAPQRFTNATGDHLETDGRMVVLMF